MTAEWAQLSPHFRKPTCWAETLSAQRSRESSSQFVKRFSHRRLALLQPSGLAGADRGQLLGRAGPAWCWLLEIFQGHFSLASAWIYALTLHPCVPVSPGAFIIYKCLHPFWNWTGQLLQL